MRNVLRLLQRANASVRRSSCQYRCVAFATRKKLSRWSVGAVASICASSNCTPLQAENLDTQQRVLFEVCIDSVASGLAAEGGGADRVELCSNLIEGGTTPSIGMVRILRRTIGIPIHVIIRPRGGDFLYSNAEMEIMLADIEAMKAEGVDGVVIGVLQADGNIDCARTKLLCDRARPLSVTFHRAFDVTPDYNASLEACLEIGIDRILTSGQQASAAEHAAKSVIGKLVTKSEGRCKIMVGAGITSANVADIVIETGAREIHASAGRATLVSPMQYRPSPPIHMGSEKKNTQQSEFELKVVTAQNVRSYVDAIRVL